MQEVLHHFEVTITRLQSTRDSGVAVYASRGHGARYKLSCISSRRLVRRVGGLADRSWRRNRRAAEACWRQGNVAPIENFVISLLSPGAASVAERLCRGPVKGQGSVARIWSSGWGLGNLECFLKTVSRTRSSASSGRTRLLMAFPIAGAKHSR